MLLRNDTRMGSCSIYRSKVGKLLHSHDLTTPNRAKKDFNQVSELLWLVSYKEGKVLWRWHLKVAQLGIKPGRVRTQSERVSWMIMLGI
jgi:hypothetical protein